VDFIAWGWSADAISNMSPVVNGHTIAIGDEFYGAGVGSSGTGSIQRQGEQDHNNASDFAWVSLSKGAQNSGLTVPFPGSVVYIPIVPTNSGHFVSGVWSGNVSVLEISTNIYLQADDGAGHIGDSNPFDVGISPSGDLDGDGIPNDWEDRYYGGPTNADPAAICANGVNTVMDAYVAGFDPTNPAALFVMTQLGGEGSALENIVMQWMSVSGRVYTIYWTSNLFSDFSPVQSNYTGGVFTDVTHSADDEGFYRIEVQVAE
jgi:hypothetical protein